jgi:DNA mismatch repair protein MutS
MAEKKYTPMIQQYLAIKEKHPDTLILFRLGDFYELFFHDAEIASRELQLFLTGKSAGVDEKVPMCGVPHHAINSYIDKLISKGYKVGIVEQTEDPALAKGLVERDVVQIITPGANIDVKAKDNNYIGCLDLAENRYVFSYADVSTGEIYVENLEKDIDEVISEITNLSIKEVVVATNFSAKDILTLRNRKNVLISYENDNNVSIEHEYILNNVYDLFQRSNVVRLLNYLKETQKSSLDYMKQAKVIKSTQAMQIDAFSRNNLELIRTIRSEDTYGTLFWLLDKTKTNMGSRLLKKWVMKPLCDIKEITIREDIVDSLINNFLVRDDIAKDLKDIYDLERLIAKINFGSANGRDMLALKRSLQIAPKLLHDLKSLNSKAINSFKGIDYGFEDLTDLLERAISENVDVTLKDGGIFKKGFDATLDDLIDLSEGGKNWVANLEAREKERTGIKTMRVGYNKVFGYYIEVSKGQTDLIQPEWGYERKQTTVNSERYITQELKDHEASILTAEDRRCALEYEMFVALRKKVSEYTEQIQDLATIVSYIDCLIAFAEVSIDNNYVRPTFNDNRTIEVINGRHPVIEKVSGTKEYVPNDIIMNKDTDILVITGPNMGGKSTYMRQFALIVIMAQIGCFVPAEKASLMIFNSIFTRIGASDDLVSGQSTFMVEMNETNLALRHADENSLLIFDEIGRGTATYDGMALAQAIIEYIATKIKAKTMFSTHYHEITKIEKEIPSIKNVHVSVADKGDEITFLYKIQDGAMGKSYGINVARLACLPEELLIRSSEILDSLEENGVQTSSNVLRENVVKVPSWVEEVKKVDPLSMSPMEALNFLYDLKKKMGGK